jgi:DNA-binding NtrC family response regulator
VSAVPGSTAIVPVVLLVTETGEETDRIQSVLNDQAVELIWADNREAAVNVLDRTHIDILITQLRTERIQGLALLELARKRNPELGGILIIQPAEAEEASRTMNVGIVDYQASPINLLKLSAVIDQIRHRQRLVMDVSRLSLRLNRKLNFPNLIGNSGAMTRLRSRLQEIAPLEVQTLLVGEDGSGKDLIAAIVHQNSPRRNAPFVSIDCDVLPVRQLTKELFGTPGRGRSKRKPGRLEIASEGVLHLDNVDSLPRELQERLADLLRTGLLRPDLGAEQFEIHPRLISSANADLRPLVDEGKFDESLFSLLSEATIEIVPLRHRRRDISQSAEYFLAEFCDEAGKAVRLSREALDRMTEYDWPGNVRELRNVIRELVGRAEANSTIGDLDLPLVIRQARLMEGMIRLPLGTTFAAAEERLIVETLKLCGNNRERTADVLGIGVRTLYRKLGEYKSNRSGE